MRRVRARVVFVEEDDVRVRDELCQTVLVRKNSTAGTKEKDSHRLDALPRLAPHVDAEHAVAPPFAFAGEPVEPDHVAERRLDRSALKVDPVERRRAVRGSCGGDGRPGERRAGHRGAGGVGRGRRAGCRRRVGWGRWKIGVVLGHENGAEERDELVVGDVGQRVVVDHGSGVGVIWEAGVSTIHYGGAAIRIYP